jgi:predicted ABC-type ATPase
MTQQKDRQPRLRLIAGPNGSGKTTLANNVLIKDHPKVRLGQYLNPDDIARHINLEPDVAAKMAQQIAMGLREDWVEQKRTFTYESVMSHESHVDFVARARQQGFRTYLYFVCTNAADLNVSRVEQRVDLGGHDVPEEKIRERYQRSLLNLPKMLEQCHRAYFFDNSAKDMTLLGEMDGDDLLLDEAAINQTQPRWFLETVLRGWDTDRIKLI